jgi:ferredoxin--NADP+ reductase
LAKEKQFKIIEKRKLAPAANFFKITAPDIARVAGAGQFVVVRLNEQGERIPLTIADHDREEGTLTLIFQEIGKTTKQLAGFRRGSVIKDVIGPLGHPTEIKNYGTVVCVGGGFGAATMYPIARGLRDTGNYLISLIGARNESLLIYEQELGRVSDELHITTDDGSKGRKGVVTDVLKDLLVEKKIDMVFAVGPAIMMKFVSLTTKPFGTKTTVSLNPIMVDGTGMCGSCRVSVGGLTRFVCVDGPEFDAHQVDFDELMARQRLYLDEEKKATERWELGRSKAGETAGCKNCQN